MAGLIPITAVANFLKDSATKAFSQYVQIPDKVNKLESELNNKFTTTHSLIKLNSQEFSNSFRTLLLQSGFISVFLNVSLALLYLQPIKKLLTPVPPPPREPSHSEQIRNNPWLKLTLCIAVDLLSVISWNIFSSSKAADKFIAGISAFFISDIFQSDILMLVAFVEEFGDSGISVLPTATLCWMAQFFLREEKFERYFRAFKFNRMVSCAVIIG